MKVELVYRPRELHFQDPNQSYLGRYEQTRHRLKIPDILKCHGCSRRWDIDNPVLPQGSLFSKFVIIGSAPGRVETQSNQILDQNSPTGSSVMRMLSLLGLQTSEVYITNASHCRGTTKKNQKTVDRPIEEFELAQCTFWKTCEFASLPNAIVIIALGNDAFRQCVGFDHPSMLRNYGKFYKYLRHFVVPVLHPAYIARNKKMEKPTFSFLEALRETLVKHVKES